MFYVITLVIDAVVALACIATGIGCLMSHAYQAAISMLGVGILSAFNVIALVDQGGY